MGIFRIRRSVAVGNPLYSIVYSTIETMSRFDLLSTIIIAKIVILTSCIQDPSSPDANLGPERIIQEDERIFIADRTGKKWDVTHALKRYGMEPSKFQFGLGPNAIRPILTPRMLSPGDTDYPDDEADFLVLGTTLNDGTRPLSDGTRSYAIIDLTRHEIVDEKFGDLHVAVAY